jgi:hypothetical protein
LRAVQLLLHYQPTKRAPYAALFGVLAVATIHGHSHILEWLLGDRDPCPMEHENNRQYATQNNIHWVPLDVLDRNFYSLQMALRHGQPNVARWLIGQWKKQPDEDCHEQGELIRETPPSANIIGDSIRMAWCRGNWEIAEQILEWYSTIARVRPGSGLVETLVLATFQLGFHKDAEVAGQQNFVKTLEYLLDHPKFPIKLEWEHNRLLRSAIELQHWLVVEWFRQQGSECKRLVEEEMWKWVERLKNSKE